MSAMAPIEQVAPSDGKDPKMAAEQLDDIEMSAANMKPSRTLEAPPAIQAMTADERQRKERAMVRKIDCRLLPPLIIMYIMNYLDRYVHSRIDDVKYGSY